MTDQDVPQQTFNFGARPTWNTDAAQQPNSRFDIHEIRRRLPGSYIPDVPVPNPPVDDQPQVPNDLPRPQPQPQPTAQNPDRTCRICLSGPEDGILSLSRGRSA